MHKMPQGWPLRQLRIPKAHEVTRGRADVVVAVIDLGYHPHPDHEGHLWVNPNPTRGDVHGWDCHDDDASLQYDLHDPDSVYHRGHHAFIVGEVIACAPACRVMIVRVGYRNPDSWRRGIDHAVEHGAKVLVIPHGFITHGRGSRDPLFYRGTDFSYPIDNPPIRRALDEAYNAGCLVFRGTADNRGRRVAVAMSAVESVISVGSTNRSGKAADIAASADYVEVAAPGGQRGSTDPKDAVWGTGGDADYIPLTGGCMAAGFAAGVGALAVSRYPDLSNEQIRQILRNTARGQDWDSLLGWGILDAARAVSVKADALCQRLKVKRNQCRLLRRGARPVLELNVEGRGAFDVRKALAVVFNGDPRRPAAKEGTLHRPVILRTRQLGHAVGPVRGLHAVTFKIELAERPGDEVWAQVCTLDRHGSGLADTARIRLSNDAGHART